MALQAQQAEMEQMYGGGDQQKAQAYQEMAGTAKSGSNFHDAYAQYR